mmetsp:Transcript_47074/g.84915  ORF Transcript_47074/g.84915 Transcript_47074/m.84915 type:complete len:252 (+) Transcript_47074:32-787(+)
MGNVLCCEGDQDADACMDTLQSSKSPYRQEEAASGLADLARVKASHRDKEWISHAIPILVEALTSGRSLGVQEQAARALANLTVADTVNSGRIVDAGGVPALVGLVSSTHDPSGSGRTQAARALANMSVANQVAAIRISEAGGVRALMTALLDEGAGGWLEEGAFMHAEVAGAIANLAAADARICQEILGHVVAVPRLQMLAQSADEPVRAQARRALVDLSEQSARARQALQDADAFMKQRALIQAYGRSP